MNEIKLLTTYRKKSKKTLEHISQELGITMRTVQRWIAGKNEPSPMAREKILSYINQISPAVRIDPSSDLNQAGNKKQEKLK